MQRHVLKRHGKLPQSLNSLRVFEAAARYLSFTDAATELNVTQSAVSRQIRQLEDNLGLTLFIRLHRSLALTNEGRELSTLLTRQFGELNRAIYQLTPSQQGELKVKVETSLASRWLAGRMVNFRRQYPDIQVELTLAWFQNGVNVNLESGGYDVAIFGEKYPDARYSNNMLRKEVMAPVYAPALSTGNKALSLADTLSLPRIHPTQDRADWHGWLHFNAIADHSLDKGITFNSLDLAVSAATSGEGAAMVDIMLILEQLKEQQLLLPANARLCHSPWQYYYYLAPQSNADKEAGIFIHWLKQEMAHDITLLEQLCQQHGWQMPDKASY
ncbi:LysR substrate-binding domain-containing protein [Thalassomonas actiniarum]|uniref:LysR family transcriptional regulator n=1 Tax=Thalassomonas actiniarum TaxID=485447 RepID=A0AAF0C105_9GAMM|nr:LysR substrate-binding domain-containing protein [Thalassomonas actiniarum]WDD97057.1 LysR family transcriptional regulator [Thalassomonas actiniarum]